MHVERSRKCLLLVLAVLGGVRDPKSPIVGDYFKTPCHRIGAQHGRVRIPKIAEAEPAQRTHMGDLRGRALPHPRRGVLSKVQTSKHYWGGVFRLLGLDLDAQLKS